MKTKVQSNMNIFFICGDISNTGKIESGPLLPSSHSVNLPWWAGTKPMLSALFQFWLNSDSSWPVYRPASMSIAKPQPLLAHVNLVSVQSLLWLCIKYYKTFRVFLSCFLSIWVFCGAKNTHVVCKWGHNSVTVLKIMFDKMSFRDGVAFGKKRNAQAFGFVLNHYSSEQKVFTWHGIIGIPSQVITWSAIKTRLHVSLMDPVSVRWGCNLGYVTFKLIYLGEVSGEYPFKLLYLCGVYCKY